MRIWFFNKSTVPFLAQLGADEKVWEETQEELSKKHHHSAGWDQNLISKKPILKMYLRIYSIHMLGVKVYFFSSQWFWANVGEKFL